MSVEYCNLSLRDAQLLESAIQDDRGADLLAELRRPLHGRGTFPNDLRRLRVGRVSLMNLVAESSGRNCFFDVWSAALNGARPESLLARFPNDFFTHVLAMGARDGAGLALEAERLAALYFGRARDAKHLTEMKSAMERIEAALSERIAASRRQDEANAEGGSLRQAAAGALQAQTKRAGSL